nr:immunoglobulin light chain junction region [Macaca mulatta]
CQQGDNFPFTF